MMGMPSSLTLRARYIFPVDEPPIAHGWIEIADGYVVAMGEGDRDAIDLGNVAILPGFVNAHTHLELSALPGEQPFDLEAGNPECPYEWLRRMVAWRRGSDPGQMRSVVEQNISQVIAHGTTSVGDITTEGMSWDAAIASPLRGVIFTELIGLRRARGLQTSEAAFAWLAKVRPTIAENNPRLRSGVSPHAPYSTSGWLYQRAITARLPLSTHLAEMADESIFLETRHGPLREFLEEIKAWDDGWQALGGRSADYIRKGELRQADWLVAHGNYLEPSDYWQLRQHAAPDGQRVAIAYCPRTHARFGHQTHPFREMLKRDIIVCLGTDSLATTPTLSVLDEIRFLHQKQLGVSGALLLAMGTIFGAWALRLDSVCGSLVPGKAADLAIIRLPDREAADPHDLLFESQESVLGTMIGGEFVQGPWILP